MSTFINFKKLSEWGLIGEINSTVLHKYGLSLSYDTESGKSDGCVAADDFIFEYSPEAQERIQHKLKVFQESYKDLISQNINETKGS